MRLERLFPDPESVELETVVAELELGERAPPKRPYLVLNMVSSADGKATIEGRTRKLGTEADTLLFKRLRTAPDAVMAGAGTLRVERYGRLLKDEQLREQRRAASLEPEPVAVLVSGRLDLPSDLGLLQEQDARVVIVTRSPESLNGVSADVQYVRITGEAGLSEALEQLRFDHGIRSILCEGGPTLNDSLLREGLVDELFLTLSPVLPGGGDPLTIVAGQPLPEPAELELVSVHRHDSELYLRYRFGS